MPRPNLAKLATAISDLLNTPSGGWTYASAIADVVGDRKLTAPELARLGVALHELGHHRPAADDRHVSADELAHSSERRAALAAGASPEQAEQHADTFAPADYDPSDDEGPFYDRAKALDEPGDDEPAEREQPAGPDDDEDETPLHDQPGYREEAPFDQLTPEEDRAEWTEAARAREPALTMDDGKGGTLVVEYPPGNADAEATAKGLAAALQDENIEGLEISTRERTEEGHPERRPTAIRLLDCKSDLRRLRVTLALEQARELADVGRPISSEAMRSLEALHPLRKTLSGESFDAVFDTVVDAIEEAWGEFYSEPE